MEGYSLSDLRRLADEYGVLLGGCTREEAVALLRPVYEGFELRRLAGDAVVAGALALVANVCKGYFISDPEGFYAALQLPMNATESEIKAAHKQRSLLLHEDRHASAPEELYELAKQMQQKINTAKEVLSDPRSRAAYHHQGTAGVQRAALVPANLGTRDFISNLDLLAQKEKLMNLHHELDASGSAVVRFDCTNVFDSLTDKIHDGLDAVGYHWDWEPADELYEEGEEEEEGEESEEEGEGQGEEEEEEKGGEEIAIQPKSSSLKVARVDINGKQMFVIIPDQEVQDKLERNLRSQLERHEQEVAEAEADALPNVPFANSRIVQGLINWPKRFPHPTQVFLSHAFSYPVRPGHVLMFSAGGPQSWFKTAYTYGKAALTEYTAKMKLQAAALTIHLQVLRRLTSTLEWALRYKVVSDAKAASWGSSLTSILRRSLGEGRDVTAKLHVSPILTERKLTWIYSKWDEMCSTSYSLDLGYLSLGGTVINRLMLPRRGPVVTDAIEDEDEAEAARTSGSLTTVCSQDLIDGSTRISWKAMFNISRKSTANQLGFGISTSLPYCFLGFAWSTSPNYQARTELQLVFKRNRFSIAAPIAITTATDGPTTATYLLAPVILFKLAQELVIKPWSAMRRRKEVILRRVMHRDKQWEEHRRALREQQLLAPEAKRRLNEELATEGGLVIQNAKYGCLHPIYEYPGDAGSELPPNVIDVTTVLQAKVTNHGLILPAGPKHQYNGFYNVDPDGEEEKYVKVRYLFHDQPHEVEILEHMELALPLIEHKLDPKREEANSPRQSKN